MRDKSIVLSKTLVNFAKRNPCKIHYKKILENSNALKAIILDMKRSYKRLSKS